MSTEESARAVAQIIYTLAVIGWVCAIMGPFFWGMKWAGLLRVPRSVEITGIDESHHGGSAYEIQGGSSEGGMLLAHVRDLEKAVERLEKRRGEEAGAPV